QQDVVPTRGGDFERAFGVRLPFHFGKIDVVPRTLGEQLRHIHGGPSQGPSPLEEFRDFRECPGAEHLKPSDDAGFGQILARENERLDTGRSGGERDRQRTSHRPNRALQAELSENRDLLQPTACYLFGGRQDTERDWQIEGRALLADVGGREIDGDAFERKGETGIGKRRIDAIASFLYSTLWQADRSQ